MEPEPQVLVLEFNRFPAHDELAADVEKTGPFPTATRADFRDLPNQPLQGILFDCSGPEKLPETPKDVLCWGHYRDLRRGDAPTPVTDLDAAILDLVNDGWQLVSHSQAQVRSVHGWGLVDTLYFTRLTDPVS